MSDWTPPKNGTPCWVEIPATDVARAKAFYAEVFGWTFKPAPAEGQYSADKMAMFKYPDEKLGSLGGGIVRLEEGEVRKGKGGVVVHLYVDNTEATVEAGYPFLFSKIKEAGGKAVGEKYAEGDSGWIQDFEDTEGNFGGIYTTKKDK